MIRRMIYYGIFILLFISCNANKPVVQLTFDSNEFTKEEQLILDDDLIDFVGNANSDVSNCIQANYVGFERGSKRMVHRIFLSNPLKEATLNYEVKFDNDFQFVRGGKLHGLGPKNTVTGGNPMHGDGWSTRVRFKESGRIAPYIYHQDIKGKYGEGKISESPVLIPGKWHKVALYVKVNDPPSENNGIVEVWVDNQIISKRDSLRLRSTGGDSTLINQILFSTFHGGHRPVNAPKNDLGEYTTVKAWFDNFKLYDKKHIEN